MSGNINRSVAIARLRVVLYADDVVVASSEDGQLWSDTLDSIIRSAAAEDDGDDDDEGT